MPDLRARLRAVETNEPPEYWPDAVSRTPRPLPPRLTPLRRGAVVVLALALSATALGVAVRAFSGEPRRPKPAATFGNGPIWVRQGSGEGGSRIYALDPSTGDVRPLWQDGRNPDFSDVPIRPEIVSWDYAFSPDGTRVAFTRNVNEGDGSCCYELFTMNADGTHLQQLTHDKAYASFPSWSPDGSRIVYSRYDGSEYIPGCELTRQCPADLFVIDADGTEGHRITQDASDEATPSWSPDGTRIAYVGANGDAWSNTIETIAPDGTGRQVVVPSGDELRVFTAWSPDGSTLAYEAATRDATVEVRAVEVSTGVVRTVVETGRDTTGGRPVWSPDGTSIAFAHRGDAGDEVWVVGADGSDPHLALNAPSYGVAPLAWRPVPAGVSPTVEHTLVPAADFHPVVRQTIDVAPSANAILYAAGSLWIPAYDVIGGGGADRSMLFRLDPDTGETVDRVPIVSTPAMETGGGGIAYAFGAIWITGGTREGAIVQRVDPATDRMTDVFPVPGDGGQSITVNGSGLWIGSYGAAAHVSHVDPSDGHVIASFEVKGIQVRRIVSVSDVVIAQSLYWTDNGGPCGHDAVFDPSTDRVVTSRDIPHCGAYEEIPWRDELWAAGDAFARLDPMTLDPTGERTEYPSYFPRSFVLVGPDEAIWYAAYPGGNGVRPDTLARFDPTTGSIHEYDVHVGAIAAAATEDSIWMLQYGGSLTRLALHG
jgi:Tol biopolymer transport system component